MQITPYKIRVLTPPKDNLHEAIKASRLTVREGDVVAISSKVVSIGEGSTLRGEDVSKDKVIKKQASWYLNAPKTSLYRRIFTIAGGAMVGSAGVDESNGDGYFILYPKNPAQSARQLRRWIQRTYHVKKIGVIITDSTSIPLRRGAVGFALAWSGFKPLRQYSGTPDLFQRLFKFEVANIADSLAAAANLVMGEGAEQTPLVVIRSAPNLVFTETDREQKGAELAVPPSDDIFAPLFFNKKWKSNTQNDRDL